MRIRSTKPEMARCLALAQVPPEVRWTFQMLLSVVDDEGRALDDVRLIKADIYPLDDITAAQVDEHLDMLAKTGELLCRYVVSGVRLLHVPRFRDDQVPKEQRAEWGQRPQKPQPSRYPPCEHSHSAGGQLALFDQYAPSTEPLPDHSQADMGKSVPQGPGTRDQGPGTRDQGPGGGRAIRDQVRTAPPDAFGRFWAIYPRREGKRAAQQALDRALQRAAWEVILAGAVRYRDDPNRVDRYTKHAATWLNQDCWGDDPLPPRRDGPRLARTDERVINGMAMAAQMRAESRGAGP